MEHTRQTSKVYFNNLIDCLYQACLKTSFCQEAKEIWQYGFFVAVKTDKEAIKEQSNANLSLADRLSDLLCKYYNIDATGEYFTKRSQKLIRHPLVNQDIKHLLREISDCLNSDIRKLGNKSKHDSDDIDYSHGHKMTKIYPEDRNPIVFPNGTTISNVVFNCAVYTDEVRHPQIENPIIDCGSSLAMTTSKILELLKLFKTLLNNA
jgi:hypothetical protein